MVRALDAASSFECTRGVRHLLGVNPPSHPRQLHCSHPPLHQEFETKIGTSSFSSWRWMLLVKRCDRNTVSMLKRHVFVRKVHPGFRLSGFVFIFPRAGILSLDAKSSSHHRSQRNSIWRYEIQSSPLNSNLFLSSWFLRIVCSFSKKVCHTYFRHNRQFKHQTSIATPRCQC